MEIKTLVTKAHENAVKHGFWEPPLPFGTAIALIHSELSEALEEERNGNPDIWFACNESDNFICTPQDETECLMYGKESLCKYRSRKPEGVAVELADAVIRIADLCGHQKGKRRRKLRRKRHDVRRLRSDRRRYSVLKIDWGKAVKIHGQTQRKQSQNKGHGNPSEP